METDGEPHDIHCNTTTGSWVAGESAGGKNGLSSFRFNPSYQFVPTDPSVTITMYQLDQRGHSVKVPWMDMHLFMLTPESHTALESGKTEQLKTLKPTLSLSTRLKSVDITVTPGTKYTLVPAAHSAGVEGHYCTCSGSH